MFRGRPLTSVVWCWLWWRLNSKPLCLSKSSLVIGGGRVSGCVSVVVVVVFAG